MLQDSNSSLAKLEIDTTNAVPPANQAESTEALQQLESVKDAGHDDLFQAECSTSHASQETQSRQAEVAEADGTPVASEGHIQATLHKVDAQAANAQNRYQPIRSMAPSKRHRLLLPLQCPNNTESAANAVIWQFQTFAVIFCSLLFGACSGRLYLVHSPR